MKKDKSGVVKWVLLGAGALFMLALFVFNTTNRPPSPHVATGVWHESMLMGDKDAPSKLIEYTDYFCSFCAEFQEPTMTDEFKKGYIESGELNYEARVVTVLREISPNTNQGAEAAHCAADQGKFWEYSETIVPKIKKEFFDKGIGVKNVANPRPIEKLPLSYFTDVAKKVDADVDEFTSCMENGKFTNQIEADTNRAIGLGVTGLPFIVANDYVTSGFQGGWSGLEKILQAGGVTLD